MTNLQEIAQRENELRVSAEILIADNTLELAYYFNDEPTEEQPIQIKFEDWAEAAVRVGIFYSYDENGVRLFNDASITYEVDEWIEYTATRKDLEEILKNVAGVESVKHDDKALYNFNTRTQKRIDSEHKCKKLSRWLNIFDYTADLRDSSSPNFTALNNSFRAINHKLASCTAEELDKVHGKLTASTSASVCKYFDVYFKDRVSFMQRIAGMSTPDIEMKHQPKVLQYE